MAVDLPRPRPRGSGAERSAAEAVASALARLGLVPNRISHRSLRHPAATAVAACLLALGGVGLISARRPGAALVVLVVAFLGALREAPRNPVVRMLSGLPLVSCETSTVWARVEAARPADDPDLVVVAGLGTQGEPRGIRAAGPLATGALVAAAVAALATPAPWPVWMARALAVVPAAGLVWAVVPRRGPAGGDASLEVLVAVAGRAVARPPARGLWLVAAGGGSAGLSAFLERCPEAAREGWVIWLEEEAGGEVAVVAPSVTHPLVRALAGAALDSGEAVDVRAVRRFTLPAVHAAVGRRVAVATLVVGDESASAVRAAELLDCLARTLL